MAEPPISTPSSSATPAKPTSTPASRRPWERSSWSTQIASSAVNRGAEATRMPASEEEISSSPAEIRKNGPATWTAPTRASHPARARTPASAPWKAATGRSTSAASAIRTKATIEGERSRSPILMNRYEAPQIAPSTSSSDQERRSIPPWLRNGGAGRRGTGGASRQALTNPRRGRVANEVDEGAGSRGQVPALPPDQGRRQADRRAETAVVYRRPLALRQRRRQHRRPEPARDQAAQQERVAALQGDPQRLAGAGEEVVQRPLDRRPRAR